jgi:uncharacterized protein YyaL (SSP411 family)
MIDPRRLAQTLANLEGWLQTMRQVGGYGGPVSHWWQNRFSYTGPGLDWRYEGILSGYALLLEKTGAPKWCVALQQAAADLLAGQEPDGSYRASCFERNPGTLGTPHEAAATLGLLRALPHLDREKVLRVARRNLDNLITQLWDGTGFSDKPGISGRVPNKLATLAQALMTYCDVSGDNTYLPYARAALEDVLQFQVGKGHHTGAVHQYAPDNCKGDGRFFPYYAARCVPPLLQGSQLFQEPRYRETAERIGRFLEDTMKPEGSWIQIAYRGGGTAAWPRWLAGCADILLAYHSLGKPIPGVALERLLSSQLPSGGFPTAQGFAYRDSFTRFGTPDYRDVTPVVGWNDKVFRLLAELLEPGTPLPAAVVTEAQLSVRASGQPATLHEDSASLTLTSAQGGVLYLWFKDEPWARVVSEGVDRR